MRIVIVGMGKSRTIALFFAVRSAMPAGTQLQLEPRAPVDVRSLDAVAKGLLHPRFPLPLDFYRQFDRIVLLVRDPRDLVISKALFRIFGARKLHAEPDKLAQRLALDAKAMKRDVPEGLHRVFRTGRAGNWRNWFCPEECSRYVERLIRERTRGLAAAPGRPAAVPAAVRPGRQSSVVLPGEAQLPPTVQGVAGNQACQQDQCRIGQCRHEHRPGGADRREGIVEPPGQDVVIGPRCAGSRRKTDEGRRLPEDGGEIQGLA